MAITIIFYCIFLLFVSMLIGLVYKAKQKSKKQLTKQETKMASLLDNRQPVVTKGQDPDDILMYKYITVRRPGPKSKLPCHRPDIVNWAMRVAKINYDAARIHAINYIAYCKRPRRKKAKGYYEITIKYGTAA